MDIKEFVTETISQISNGVIEANKMLTKEAKITNITTGGWVPQDKQMKEIITPINIEFDIAITISEREENGGGAGITVASILNLSGGATSSSSQQSVSRVKFVLPLVLPNNDRTL